MWFVIPKFSCEGELRKSVYLIMAKISISDLALWVFSGINTCTGIRKADKNDQRCVTATHTHMHKQKQGCQRAKL